MKLHFSLKALKTQSAGIRFPQYSIRVWGWDEERKQLPNCYSRSFPNLGTWEIVFKGFHLSCSKVESGCRKNFFLIEWDVIAIIYHIFLSLWKMRRDILVSPLNPLCFSGRCTLSHKSQLRSSSPILFSLEISWL